jgi:branched-chain amino acid transport system substrate-binding protein
MKTGYPKILLFVLCAIVLLAVLSFTSCSNGSATQSSTATVSTSDVANTSSTAGKELKVGFITPSTGGVSYKGIPGQHGYLDAVSYINGELGGVNGYKIKPLWYDSAYKSETSTTAIEALKDQGALLFLTMSSTEMGYVQAIANNAGFPGIATFTTPSNYRPPAHIYGQMPDYGDDWVAFTNYYLQNVWKGPGKPKMALHLINNVTGYGVRDAEKAKAESMGVEIVDVEEHTATDISMDTSMARIKALNPDVLFISSTDKPTYLILKAAHDMGMTPNMTIGLAHATYSKALVEMAGLELLEGIYVSLPWVTWSDSASGLVKAKEYVQKNNPKDEGDGNYLSCWAGSLVVAEILKNALNAVGYDALAKGDASAWQAIETSGIQKLGGYDVGGIQGPVSYTPGDNRLAKTLKMYTVKNGILTAVSNWVDAPVTKYEEFSWWGK